MRLTKRYIRIHEKESKFHVPISIILMEINKKGYYASMNIMSYKDISYKIMTNIPLTDLRKIKGVFDAI